MRRLSRRCPGYKPSRNAIYMSHSIWYMDPMYRLAVAISCPILGLVLHELTHISVAKYQGMTSVEIISVFPKFRMEISYPDTQSERGRQIMAISPFIFGVITALTLVLSGLWRQIQLEIPYYFEGILILTWIGYSHLSPADVRTIVAPSQRTLS